MKSEIMRTVIYTLYLNKEERDWLLARIKKDAPSVYSDSVARTLELSDRVVLSEHHADWLRAVVQNPFDGENKHDRHMRELFWKALGGSDPSPVRAFTLHGTPTSTIRPPIGMANSDIPF